MENKTIGRRFFIVLRVNLKYVIKHIKIFVGISLMPYLCISYPEYNLFTFKKLIPIEMNAPL